jgi:cytoskeletal protein CcmA (bactofilin family)
VPTVILNGRVAGDVRSDERIELASRAEVNGDVYYNLIEMAMGGAVNGSLFHQTEKSTSVISFERESVDSTVGKD